MIEDLIYARLNDATVTSLCPNVYATDPGENTSLPFLYFALTSNTPTVSLSGLAAQNMYDLSIHVFAKTVLTRNSVLEAVKGRLQLYHGGYFQGIFLQNEQSEEIGNEEEGLISHGIQTYRVVAVGTPVAASPDPMATVNTTMGMVTLSAGGNQMILSSSGLTLNGQNLTPSNTGNTFVYQQSTPATTWAITHNLNNWPSVSVVDSGGNKVFGEVAYPDANHTTLTFFAPFSGRAFLN